VARKLDDVMAALPAERRARIERRAMEVATLKDLRAAAQKTQEDLAAALGVGQDSISRLERLSDMLLSTLRHYVESMGGTLELVAQFPDRPPVVIEHLGVEHAPRRRSSHSRATRGILRQLGNDVPQFQRFQPFFGDCLHAVHRAQQISDDRAGRVGITVVIHRESVSCFWAIRRCRGKRGSPCDSYHARWVDDAVSGSNGIGWGSSG